MTQSSADLGWRDLWSQAKQIWSKPSAMPVPPWQKFICAMILVWEGLAQYLWPFGLAFAIWLVAALFGLFAWIPGWLHTIFLAAWAMFLLIGWSHIIRFWRWPTDAEIYHRIELSSDLPHRPLTSLQDQLLNPAENAHRQNWWDAYRQSILKNLNPLRTGLPRFGFAPFDPFAVRSILLLLIVIGVMLAGRDMDNRLWRGLEPSVPPASAMLRDLSVWVTPPEYTKMAPFPLKPDTQDINKIPINSELFVQFSGAKARPGFSVDGEKQKLQELDSKTYQGKFPLITGSVLRATIGWQNLGRWPIEIIADTPPQIAFDGEVYATPRAALRVGYKGQDDYGIATAFAEIRQIGSDEVIRLQLPVFTTGKADVKNASYHDVAYHRWAGQKVQIQLTAVDAIGQTAKSDVIETTLPERNFENPVAKRVAALRKDFMVEPNLRTQLAKGLDDVLQNPAAFNYDTKVTLALRVAEQRVEYARDNTDNDSILDLLWNVALRLEDNGVSLAESDLRKLEQSLQDAMARGASMDEIDNLLDQFESAMNRYLQAMFDQMKDENLPDLPSLDQQSPSIEVNDIDRLLMQIRQLMRSGNQAEAQKLLSKLQEIMANIRQKQGQETAENKAAMKLLQQAQGLVRDQQQLLDKSSGILNATGSLAPKVLAEQRTGQKSLAGDLQSLLQQFKKYHVPPIKPYADANEHIQSSLQAMDDKIPSTPKIKADAIVLHQTQSLENLRLGLQELLKMMQNGSSGGQARAGGGRTDPFGRARKGSGVLDDKSVKVPEIQDLERTREILDELQRRGGDYSRPEIERDYIKRLLRRF